MPALNLIPNASDLAAFMQRTLMHTPLKQVRFVQNPILDALGLQGRRALERAVQESKLLPAGLGPEHVVLGRTGEFIIANRPEAGETAETAAPAGTATVDEAVASP